MKFLLLLYGDESAEAALGPAERRAIVDRHQEFSRMLVDRGALIGGDPLAPSAGAAVVRGGKGVSDGPFAETKEQLGGYYLVECPSRDEAIELALQVPLSPGLAVEVRALADMQGGAGRAGPRGGAPTMTG
jgi:hypothetical protein